MTSLRRKLLAKGELTALCLTAYGDAGWQLGEGVSESMFRIEMLPAEQGDALWIEYGPEARPHRVLIDGGVRKTATLIGARIAELPKPDRQFDLLIVTHIDSDHIGGVPKLLANPPPGLRFDDVWFNAWRHLQPDQLGAVEGEIVSAQLDRSGWNWNAAFDGKAVVVAATGKLPRRTLPGGMTLTLLSPTRERLDVLRTEWKKVVEAAGLETGVQDEALAEAARRRGIPDLLGDRLDVDELAAAKLLCRTRHRQTGARSPYSPSTKA